MGYKLEVFGLACSLNTRPLGLKRVKSHNVCLDSYWWNLCRFRHVIFLFISSAGIRIPHFEHHGWQQVVWDIWSKSMIWTDIVRWKIPFTNSTRKMAKLAAGRGQSNEQATQDQGLLPRRNCNQSQVSAWCACWCIDIEYNKRLDRQRPCLEGDFSGGSNNIVQSNKSVWRRW